MVKNCCVYKCSNKFDKAKEKGVSFFRFPKDKRQRRAWVKAVNRKDWVPNQNTWICSEHFIGGWRGYEPDDENYAPTLFPYKQRDSQNERSERLQDREKAKEAKMLEIATRERDDAMKNLSLTMHTSYCASKLLEEEVENQTDVELEDLNDTNIIFSVSTGTQSDPDPLLEENMSLKRENRQLKEELNRIKWGINKIKDNNLMTRFYTGIPSFAIFLWLFNFLLTKSTRMTYWSGSSSTSSSDKLRASKSMLQPIDQFLAVLMRNRLGLFVQDVSDRFDISSATFSKYYTTWLSLLHEELKVLNPFPSREIIQKTMPSQFKEKYPFTRIIIDCTEIFIQRASSLTNQSLTFSNYKNHNTLKFLVGITPAGVISFVSEAWGGRVSDRQITEESGLLDLLEEGDSVMADKGFTISDLLEKRKCGLNIPPFRGKSNQFTTEEVQLTQEIAELRIHVERSIGRVKNFHIFDGILPLSLAPLATRLFQVCCWLTNFDTPLVSDKYE